MIMKNGRRSTDSDEVSWTIPFFGKIRAVGHATTMAVIAFGFGALLYLHDQRAEKNEREMIQAVSDLNDTFVFVFTRTDEQRKQLAAELQMPDRMRSRLLKQEREERELRATEFRK